ncbi:hypothetical protein HBI38_023440 [Parastagonospora nodorum]|nr:hypothetical protein HBI09_154450 [Parastagonospora nodorum]KAH4998888.1 hypothetical protein HBI77_180650 [Parastagonospora nodorum]KAH5088111.1 hypothetical protein HBI73_136390 [Parastagonospora nodorum]KAH5616127.1 hypothetical protein HBI45_024790 [Parastagonospora nodorum]KAH6278261.1 hypothetical protein HBI41_040580 [Parastagonospora nodorum]
MAPQRPIRIAGCSGSTTDRRNAMTLLASNYENDPIDVLVGDWMSEGNMTGRANAKANGTIDAYEPTFLEALEPALPHIAKHRIKVAVNAGAADTQKLHDVVTKMVKAKGLDLSVAWISGDEVLPQLLEAQKRGDSLFENICTGQKLENWEFEPVYAQAYLGGLGIANAFETGADIVICGRVSDASPVIGAAYWWHHWKRSDLDKLANAFVAGHLSECSSYSTGGNYTGFKDLECLDWTKIGYPIVEIAESGEVIVTKNQGSGGEVSVNTLTSQFLYEIQGPWYFNSDVTAILDDVWFEHLATNRVALRGVKGALPPPTTKVGITAKPIYQAEMTWFITGLDTHAKARMIEQQIRHQMGSNTTNFSKLDFQIIGSCADNPTNQNAATVSFRVVAQARKAEHLAPAKFVRPCIDPIMCAYPGATPHLDLRQAFPREVFEYYVTLLPQSAIDHKVHLPNSETVDIAAPTETKVWDKHQPTQTNTSNIKTLDSFGPTIPSPLGTIVHARSGDKGSDCNIGLWVRHADEYAWLQNLLSTSFMTTLLADEYTGGRVERCEFEGLRAVHFLLKDHLDRGVSCSMSADLLGKNCAEYVRARWVDVPVKFLSRGRV